MLVTCPYCNEVDVEVYDNCPKCTRFCYPADVVRPIEDLLEQLARCSRCGDVAFDGWRCHACEASIAEKAKKAQGCVLNDKEVELVVEHFKNRH